jgi:hypothetical protein
MAPGRPGGLGAVATLTLGLLAAGYAIGLDRPDLIPGMSTRAVFAKAGVGDQVTNVAFLIAAAAFAVTGLLIFWRRSTTTVPKAATPPARMVNTTLRTGPANVLNGC